MLRTVKKNIVSRVFRVKDMLRLSNVYIMAHSTRLSWLLVIKLPKTSGIIKNTVKLNIPRLL